MSVRYATLSLLLCTWLIAGNVLAQSAVSVQLSQMTSPISPGDTLVYDIEYTMAAGNYKNVVIQLDLPQPAWYTSSMFPSGRKFLASCQEVGSPLLRIPYSWKWSCTFTLDELDLSDAGISGKIQVYALSRRFGILDGEQLQGQVTMSGEYEYSGSGWTPFPTETDIETTTFQAYASVELVDNSASGENPVWKKINGVIGYTVDYQFFARNHGNAPVGAGAMWTLTIPEFMVFRGYTPRMVNTSASGNMGWTLVDSSNNTIVFQTTHPFSIRSRPEQTSANNTDYVSVWLWIPCNKMTLPAENYHVTLSFEGEEERVGNPPISHSDSITLTSLPSSHYSTPCGFGAEGITFSPIECLFPQTAANWSSLFKPPRGVFPLVDPLIVVPIPEWTSFCGISGSNAQDFVHWYCSVDISGAFTDTEFWTQYKDQNCTTSPPSPLDPAITHLVFTKPQWGTEDSIDHLYSPLVTLSINEGAPHNQLIEFNAFFFASNWDESWGPPPVASIQKNVTHVVKNSVSLQFRNPNGQPLPSTSVSPGTPMLLRADLRNSCGPIARSPVVDLLIPAGLEMTDTPSLVSGCSEIFDIVQFQQFPQSNGSLLLRWGFPGWNSALSCKGPCDLASAVITFNVPVRVRTGYPFFHNTQLTALLDAVSVPDNISLNQEAAVAVQVADEMRIDISPSCTENEEKPVFRMLFENTGGSLLTQPSLFFRMPRDGDPDTNVDTIFDNAILSVPGTIQYSTQTGLTSHEEVTSWTDVQPAPKTNITWVRANIDGGLQPLTAPGLFSIVFTPQIEPQSTYTARAKGTLDAAELPPVTTGLSIPFTLSGCPKPLTGKVFLDHNGNGIFNGDDTPLPGWQLRLYQGGVPSGVPVRLLTTGLNGEYEDFLPSGLYTLQLQIPPDTVFAVTGGETRTFTVSGNPLTEDFPVTCNCNLPAIACNTLHCLPSGNCAYFPDDSDTCSVQADPECHSNPHCSSGACIYDSKDEGYWCGTCKTCDGYGYCNRMPTTDPDCGINECEQLSTECRTYANQNVPCESLGVCMSANLLDCTDYFDLPAGTPCEATNMCNGEGNCVPSDPSGEHLFDYWYPSKVGEGTWAFEDLWPYQGDFDFNDLVLGYRLHGWGETEGMLDALQIRLVFRARGASINSGFAISLPADSCIAPATVSANLCGGQPLPARLGDSMAFTITDDTRTQLPALHGTFTNTEPYAPVQEAQEMIVQFTFSAPVPMSCVFDRINPFLFRTSETGREVHLPGYPPSPGADPSLFETGDDITNLGTETYYLTQNYLPFALDVPIAWGWPTEKSSIIQAYPQFAAWVESAGDIPHTQWLASNFWFAPPSTNQQHIWQETQPVNPDPTCCPEYMVYIAPGAFIQGSDLYPFSRPAHQVDIAYGYCIDKYLTTLQQYTACVEANACEEPEHDYYTWSERNFNWNAPPEAQREQHPINGIHWDWAKQYCNWKGKRLCSDSEWEKAARWDPVTQQSRHYPWGNHPIPPNTDVCGDYAVLQECSNHWTMPVGEGLRMLGRSPYGVQDMFGHLLQWVEDDVPDGYSWGDDYYIAMGDALPLDGSPYVTVPRSEQRVLRATCNFYSGSSSYEEYGALYRHSNIPDGSSDIDRGIRCCCSH